MKKEKVLIVGGGIAGITAAYFSAINGNKVVLIEASNKPGGLLKTEHAKSFCFDYGTHILPTTRVEQLDEFLYGGLTDKDYYYTKCIEAGNYFLGKLNEKSCHVDASVIPEQLYEKGCMELLMSKGVESSNLADFFSSRYGKTFYNEIYKGVIKKYIGLDPELLHQSVGYFFDMSLLLAFDDEVTKKLGSIPEYNSVLGHHKRVDAEYKYYPKKGGVGSFIELLMNKLENVGVEFLPNAKIENLKENQGEIYEATINGEVYNFQKLVWSLPISLLARYIPLGAEVPKPMFRNTCLFDFVFDKPLLSTSTFINVYEPSLLSGRITLYQNLGVDIVNESYSCTVEVLSDADVSDNYEDIILNELKHMGLINKDSECIFKQARPVFNGFPIITVEYKKKADELNKLYKQYLKNVLFVGKASDKVFFMPDVLRDVHNQITTQLP